jgi:hypothetical protein
LLIAATAVHAEPGRRRAVAERDLRFVHDTIEAHHAGPLNSDNPAFRNWPEQGHKTPAVGSTALPREATSSFRVTPCKIAARLLHG